MLPCERKQRDGTYATPWPYGASSAPLAMAAARLMPTPNSARGPEPSKAGPRIIRGGTYSWSSDEPRTRRGAVGSRGASDDDVVGDAASKNIAEIPLSRTALTTNESTFRGPRKTAAAARTQSKAMPEPGTAMPDTSVHPDGSGYGARPRSAGARWCAV